MTRCRVLCSAARGAMLALIALPMIAGLGGCQADTSPPMGQGDFYPAPLNDPQISVLGEDLRASIVFQHATIVRDGERPMLVQTPVRNLAERQYLIEYRYMFYDERGIEQSPAMPWTFTAMDPKQIVRLSGSAMSTDAKSYRLEVRWSR